MLALFPISLCSRFYFEILEAEGAAHELFFFFFFLSMALHASSAGRRAYQAAVRAGELQAGGVGRGTRTLARPVRQGGFFIFILKKKQNFKNIC